MYEVFITIVFLVIPGFYPVAMPIATFEKCAELRDKYIEKNRMARCVIVRRIAVIDPDSKDLIVELKKVK